MTYEQLEKAANAAHLDILGGFHTDGTETGLDGIRTLILLGPREPGFWDHFTQQSEYLDSARNPVDRWSTRVITRLAKSVDAQPFFPFTGPPYQPFFQWALRSSRCHQSPINLLVHDTAGLFVSFRGALGLADRIPLPEPPPSPCLSCSERPCESACPGDAFVDGSYNVPSCTSEIRGADRASCEAKGCSARRSCPASQSYGRVEEQSAYHMQVFLKNAP